MECREVIQRKIEDLE